MTQAEIKKMAQPYASRGEEQGQDAVREILSGARQSAVGANDPQMAFELLQAYQSVEKYMFGELGPLHKGEKDLTEAQATEPGKG